MKFKVDKTKAKKAAAWIASILSLVVISQSELGTEEAGDLLGFVYAILQLV